MSKLHKGPYLPAIDPYVSNAYAQAGLAVDPKTGKVTPNRRPNRKSTKANVQRCLELVDRQDFANRIRWYNLPSGITSQMLEKLLYYKGQLCFFYSKVLNQFFVLPYALDGPIDVYGRYTYIKPLPLGSTEEMDDEQKARTKVQNDWLDSLRLRVIYEPLTPDMVVADPTILEDAAVIIQDYTPGLAQLVTPRYEVNRGLVDLESDMLPFLRTALLNSTGVRGVRVNSGDEAAEIDEASDSIDDAALHGQKYVPIIGAMEFQDLTDGSSAQAQEFLVAMQSVDNLRLSTMGIQNGGLFQKSQYMRQAEQALNGGAPSLTLDDAITQRQNAVDIINSIWWFLDMACEAAESAIGVDSNMDGAIAADEDQSGVPGEQPTSPEGGNEDE